MLQIRVILIFSLLIQIESFVFNLESGRTKCISEDLYINSVTHAHYFINGTASHNYKISARVSDPDGESLHYAESVEKGEFAFTATKNGEHNVCFWSPYFDPSIPPIPIEFEWRTGVAMKQQISNSILRKDKISVKQIQQPSMAVVATSLRKSATIGKWKNNTVKEIAVCSSFLRNIPVAGGIGVDETK